MTLVASQQAVITTGGAKLIAPIPYSQQVKIFNRDATNSIFVGPEGVTSTTGLEVKPNQPLADAFTSLPPETEIWAVPAAATVRVDVAQVIDN